MMHQEESKADYSNWVPKKMIMVPLCLALIFFVLSFYSMWFLIGVVFFIIPAIYFLVARRMFSPQHGQIQQQVQELILEKLQPFTGKPVRILDIGCGNGPLAITAAERNPQADMVGVDKWGKIGIIQ